MFGIPKVGWFIPSAGKCVGVQEKLEIPWQRVLYPSVSEASFSVRGVISSIRIFAISFVSHKRPHSLNLHEAQQLPTLVHLLVLTFARCRLLLACFWLLSILLSLRRQWGKSPRAIGFTFGMGKLELLGCNLVKVSWWSNRSFGTYINVTDTQTHWHTATSL